jgi:hypothetical protein
VIKVTLATTVFSITAGGDGADCVGGGKAGVFTRVNFQTILAVVFFLARLTLRP